MTASRPAHPETGTQGGFLQLTLLILQLAAGTVALRAEVCYIDDTDIAGKEAGA